MLGANGPFLVLFLYFAFLPLFIFVDYKNKHKGNLTYKERKNLEKSGLLIYLPPEEYAKVVYMENEVSRCLKQIEYSKYVKGYSDRQKQEFVKHKREKIDELGRQRKEIIDKYRRD